MKTLRVDLTEESNQVYNVLPPTRPRALALGYFDGIHRGHQELVSRLLQRAYERGLEAAVFSFDRYPKPVPPHARLNAVVPGQPSPEAMILQSPLPHSEEPFTGLLQTQAQRDEVFALMGVQCLILQAFNSRFASLSAEEFCQKILLDKLNVKVLVVGEDFRFARRQEGNAEMLRRFAEKNDVELFLVPPVRSRGEIISSSLIRGLIEAGEMREAEALLGRPFAIPGTVIRGNALGRTVGMPTANIRIPFGMVIPKYGVYVSRTRVGETYYDSVTNIGLRPTVNHTDPLPLAETCILDRHMDLYDKEIEIELLDFMRSEERFPSFLAMSAKISEDLKEAEAYHASTENLYRYTLVNDIPLYLFRSQRFNTTYLLFEFYLPMDRGMVSNYSLLSQVLTAVAPEYPSRPEMQSFLDAEYGASVEAWVSRINNLHRISFRLSAVYNGIDGSKPFENCMDNFLSMLLRPVRDDEDHFLPNIIETERQNLLMEFMTSLNDKTHLAYDRAEANLMADPEDWLNPLGTKEGLEKADNRSLRHAWVKMLAEGGIRVFLYGHLEGCDEADKIAHELAAIPRRDSLKLAPGFNPEIVLYPETRVVKEKGDVELAHLIMVYDGLPPYSSNDVLAARILNYMLGEAQQSLLFTEIRETLGYAYYVDSDYDSFAQTITVVAEVKTDKIEASREVIDRQIRRLAEGDCPKDLFNSALRLYQNDLLQIRDDLEDSLSFDSNESLAGGTFSSEEVLRFTESIAEEDIRKLASKLKLRLTYCLLPRGSDDSVLEAKEGRA